MHTGVILAFVAEDAEEALSQAEMFADGVHWSDWSEHNGRWAATVPNGILRYSDDPELFNTVIDNFIESTKAEELELLRAVGHLSVEELISDPRYDYNFEMTEEERKQHDEEYELLSDEDKKRRSNEKLHRYRATKLLRMNSMEFTSEMHFYDGEWGTGSRFHLDNRIKTQPEQQFIVVWDFHF